MMHCECGGKGIYTGEGWDNKSWYRCAGCGQEFTEEEGERSILPEDE